MAKFVALLLLACLAFSGAVSAGGFPWEANRAVRNCVRERRCWEKGTTAVCGRVPGSRHRTYGFPNRCYYACVNFLSGEQWRIKNWYDAGRFCNKHWTEHCSRC